MSPGAQIAEVGVFLAYSFLYLLFVAWVSDPVAKPAHRFWRWFKPAAVVLALLLPTLLFCLAAWWPSA